MDTGKILTGFAFLLLSVALMASPSSADMQDRHCEAISGLAVLFGESHGLSSDLQNLPVPAGMNRSSDYPLIRADLP